MAPRSATSEATGRHFAAAALDAAARAIFAAAGSDGREAALLAAHLVEANLLGHDSHGIIRVAKYVDWTLKGDLLPNRHAQIVRDAGPVLVVDGGQGHGQVIAHEAIALGVARARELGIAAVSIRNTGHLGRIGAWAEEAAVAGLASLHFVNTSGFGILVAPFGGSDRRLSANPIAAGAPRRTGPPIILDIATAAIAEGKIQVARNRGEALPEGVVVDGQGRPTRDPAAFYAEPPGAIFAFGGHKGFGLSLFCEVLAGALGGGASSHPGNATAGRLTNNMLSLLFDPESFAGEDAFAADLERLAGWVQGSPPVDPAQPVLLPGDIERLTRERRRRDGIPLDPATLDGLVAAARAVGIEDGRLHELLGQST